MHAPGSGEAWTDLARSVEDLGYSTLVVSDHVVGQAIAPIAALTAAAMVTTRLRIGSLVFCNDFRHPLLLAKEAATLDLVSDGRFELGLGAGYGFLDYDALGMRSDPAGVRIERLEEAVQIVRQAFADGPVTFAGAHYKVEGADILPKPIQRPGPPIIVGGAGPKVMRLAARHADIVSINERKVPTIAFGAPTSPAFDEVDRIVAVLRDEAGDRFADIELNVFAISVMVTNDPHGMAAGVTPALRHLVDEARSTVRALVGSIEEICEILEERRERFGISYWIVPETACEAFAPIVERMSGR